MAFHRQSVPTYFGGLPGGYDYINDPATNGDAGVAAFADGKKASGVNAGTYFIGFGEDATSSDANRPAKALAQNTDIIDDVLHRDLALTSRTADVTAVSAVSSIVIAGQVYVGDNGVANTQATRDSLISVLDNNDNELLVGAVKVQAALIHDGSSNNVVGNQASGFFSTVTVNLSVAIPIGTTYRVYYGSRSNLANLPKDALTSIKIRGAQEVEAVVEQLFRDLHSSVSGTNWNDAWVANINSLARTGLDGRYRLSTVDPGATPAVNTPGNGGTIVRDGVALAVAFPTYDLTNFGTVGSSKYPDPLLAAWRLRRVSPTVATVPDKRFGGDYGVVQESPYHNSADAAEVAYNHITNAIMLDVIPRNITAATLASNAVSSRISAAGVGAVNPSGGTDATSRRTLAVASGDYIRNASNSMCAVRPSDLIEVTDNTTGNVVGTFKLDAILTNTTFTVKTVTGALPLLGPSGASAAVRLRWLQTVASFGGQHRAGADTTYGIPPLYIAQPSLLTDTPASEAMDLMALFMSSLATRGIGASQAYYAALTWGGFNTQGVPSHNGTLRGDGGIYTAGGRQVMHQVNRPGANFPFSVGGRSVQVDPQTDGSSYLLQGVSVSGAAPLTFAITSTTGWVAEEGDELLIEVTIPGGSVGPISITWPGDFVFSALDGVLPASNPSGSAYRICYVLRYRNDEWAIERSDF